MKVVPNFLRRKKKTGFVEPIDGDAAKQIRELRKLQEKIEALLDAPLPSKAYPITRTQTAEDLRATIQRVENLMVEQGDMFKEHNSKLNKKLAQLLDESSDEEEEHRTEIETGSFVVTAAGTKWRVAGYSSVEPVPDYNYFSGLSWTCDKMDAIEFKYSNDRVISAIVPCFNERGRDLERTVRSLYRQRLPTGWRLEVVVVVDGADHMDAMMCEYLTTLFGVKFNTGDPELDPFVVLPNSQTVIVDPVDKDAAHARKAAVYGIVGGYSLVVKKHNHRKANSQMWWLGPHGQFVNCTYSLATDCGTVFSRTATMYLIRRMDAEPNLHAVTGFQRIMTSGMQGDGSFEACARPFSFLLRMIQRFEFEVDHVSFKSVYDSLGCMHVIPGPCGLFRYKAMGNLKEGLMFQYFRLFQTSNKGLIAGNVELVEDRIPGTLLSFPLKGHKEEPVMPPEGWPRTGFVYDAVFYIEAEKPLSQLVKQRRRWLNGTFATYIWMLTEGIVTRSNQDPLNRFLSWLLVIINVAQGLVVRLTGPSLLIVWMFRFGLFIPDLFDDPTVIFDPKLNLVSLEIEEGRLVYGIAVAVAYLALYVAFILGHTPRAKPVQSEVRILRFTEPTAYRNDSASAYRGWLFVPVLWVNFLVVCLYIVNTIGILYTQGWDGTPFVVRLLICICFTPFVMGILDGMLRCDMRCLWGMCYSAPFALPLMLWFTIWLPAYATTRLSDLTWGNRQTASLDESKKALDRARNGRRVAWVLIICNMSIAIAVIVLMQFFGATFPIFVMTYTMVLSFTYVISFFDMAVRFFSCAHLDPSEDPVIVDDVDDDEDMCGCSGNYDTDGSSDGYVEMEDAVAVQKEEEEIKGVIGEGNYVPVGDEVKEVKDLV